MQKMFFKIFSSPEVFFEIVSESRIPVRIARRVVKEIFGEQISKDRGTLNLRFGSQRVPVQYYTKGALIKVFIPRSEEINWEESFNSFSDFLRENRLSPFSIFIRVNIPTKKPESIFNLLTDDIESLSDRLSGLYGSEITIDPEMSFEGDNFSISFSTPLDKRGIDLVEKWADDHRFQIDIKEIPIEEKSI